MEAAASSAGDLHSRLRKGEAAAVGEAYDRHSEAVRAFAWRLLGDGASAEDLVHEVFVALPDLVRGYRGDSSLHTFVMSIAANRARHYVRAAARRRAAAERFAKEPLPQGSDPEKNARSSELRLALSRALDSLPLEQRVAFVLCAVEERTSDEAATMVGAPPATVRTRLYHARKRLRQLLEEEGVT